VRRYLLLGFLLVCLSWNAKAGINEAKGLSAEESFYPLQLLSIWLNDDEIAVFQALREANLEWLPMKVRMFRYSVSYRWSKYYLSSDEGKPIKQYGFDITSPYDRCIGLYLWSEDLLYYNPDLIREARDCPPGMNPCALEQGLEGSTEVYEWKVVLEPLTLVGRNSLLDPFPPALQRTWMNACILGGATAPSRIFRVVMVFEKDTGRLIRERFEQWNGDSWVLQDYGQVASLFYDAGKSYPARVVVSDKSEEPTWTIAINFDYVQGLWLATSGIEYLKPLNPINPEVLSSQAAGILGERQAIPAYSTSGLVPRAVFTNSLADVRQIELPPGSHRYLRVKRLVPIP